MMQKRDILLYKFYFWDVIATYCTVDAYRTTQNYREVVPENYKASTALTYILLHGVILLNFRRV
jgi:hypothetical protein